MRRNLLSWLFYFVSVALLLCYAVCLAFSNRLHESNEQLLVENTSDRIHVLLYCHTSDYFLYRSRPIGFQYELIKKACSALGLKLKIDLSTDASQVKNALLSYDYDIVAVDVDSVYRSTTTWIPSVSHSTSFPVMIRRSGDTSALHKILYIPAHFPTSIQELSHQESWEIVQSSEMDVEEFFALLQDKKIDYLASDYNSAIMMLTFYPDLEIADTIGAVYDRCWMLNNANITLNQRLNQWLESYKQTDDYKALCRKYFHPHSHFLARGVYEKKARHISPYDAFIQRYAHIKKLDWRFVAAVIYQESRFTTGSVGVGGSFGIMQLMPETAAAFGIDSLASVEEQIRAGVGLIASINKQFLDIEDVNERLYFVAASYNAGSGHIQDARNLCRKYGGNDKLWLDVEHYLSLKSDKKFYNDPVVRNGYFPGKHTIRYTHAVMDGYHGYKVHYPER